MMATIDMNVVYGVHDDVDLHTVRVITENNHYRNLRAHCLRKGHKYDGVDYSLITIIDKSKPKDKDKAYHIVFEMNYSFINEPLSLQIEDKYRDYLLALSIERVFLKYLDESQIYTATVVGGENVTSQGERYNMVSALHVLFDGDVSEEIIIQILNGMYNYMSNHGYVIVTSE